MSKYLTEQSIRDPPKYMVDIMNKYVKKQYKILDIGMGNGLQYGIKLSHDKYYVGLEPFDKLYAVAKKNCKKFNCNIKIINKTFDDYSSTKKFNIILFINSFHFIHNFEKTIKKAYNFLDKDGIIIIKEPRSVPYGWASNKLNKESDEFDKIIWNKKKNILKKTKEYLLEQPNVKYYKLSRGHVFVFIKI